MAYTYERVNQVENRDILFKILDEKNKQVGLVRRAQIDSEPVIVATIGDRVTVLSDKFVKHLSSHCLWRYTSCGEEASKASKGFARKM